MYHSTPSTVDSSMASMGSLASPRKAPRQMSLLLFSSGHYSKEAGGNHTMYGAHFAPRCTLIQELCDRAEDYVNVTATREYFIFCDKLPELAASIP